MEVSYFWKHYFYLEPENIENKYFILRNDSWCIIMNGFSSYANWHQLDMEIINKVRTQNCFRIAFFDVSKEIIIYSYSLSLFVFLINRSKSKVFLRINDLIYDLDIIITLVEGGTMVKMMDNIYTTVLLYPICHAIYFWRNNLSKK